MNLDDFLEKNTKPGQIIEIFHNNEKIGMCEIDKDGYHTSLNERDLLDEVVSSRSEKVQISRNDGQSVYTQTWVRVDVKYW